MSVEQFVFTARLRVMQMTYDQLFINIQSMRMGDTFWVNAYWFHELITEQIGSASRIDHLMKKHGVVMKLHADDKIHFEKVG